MDSEVPRDDASGEGSKSLRAWVVYVQYRSEHWNDSDGFDELLLGHPDLREELLAEEQKWPELKEMASQLPNVTGSEACSFLLQTVQLSRGLSGEDRAPSPAEPVLRAVEQSDLSIRYEVLREFHRTQQSVLFKVYDRKLARISVMKVLLDSPAEAELGALAGLVDSDSQQQKLDRAQLLKEALVTSQLEHPVIVPVYDVGLDAAGRLCFVMKMIEGHTFGEIIPLVHDPADDWTLNRAVGVLRRICEALAYAHSRNVMHRDIKPHNFMVGRFGEAILMDWGLHLTLGGPGSEAEDGRDPSTDAAAAREQEGDLTRRFGLAGTPIYMSPEQARGQRHRMGPSSDIYSLGAVLYHLILGSPPYIKPGESQTVPGIIRLVATRAPEPLSKLCPGGPRDLIAICEKAMAREIDERFRSAEEFGDALAEYLEAVSRDRQEAVRQGRRAEMNSRFLLDVLSGRDPDLAQGRDVTVLEAIERASRRLGSDPPSQVEDAVALRGVLGELYLKMGRPEDSLIEFTAAHRSLVELGLQWKTDALVMASRRAWCVHSCGDSEEATAILRGVLKEQELLLGPVDSETLLTCWRLGHVQHRSASNFDEVRSLYERVIAGCARLHGETSLEVLNAKNGLARIMHETGNLTRGLELQEQAVEGMVASFGSGHTETLIQMGDLSNMYLAADRIDDAAKLSEHVLNRQIKVLGRDHPYTQVTRSNVAMLYRKQGRLELARARSQEVWESHRETAGENAQLTLTMYHNLATVDLDLGNLESAERILRECGQRLERLYPTHRLRARAQTNLARCMVATHRPREAVKELKLALKLLRTVLEPGSEWIVDAEELLARCLRDLSDDGEGSEDGSQDH